MNREESIEAMLAAYHPDWNDLDWPEAWRSEERTDMGRAFDIIAANVRRDVTMQLLNQVVATTVAAKP
jgi:ribosomal protein L11 methylase PrmA